MKQIGLRLGATKNAVIGKLDRLREYEYDGSMMMDRLQALHDRMDAVLAECAKVKMYEQSKRDNSHASS
jgi:hypothetical protein